MAFKLSTKSALIEPLVSKSYNLEKANLEKAFSAELSANNGFKLSIFPINASENVPPLIKELSEKDLVASSLVTPTLAIIILNYRLYELHYHEHGEEQYYRQSIYILYLVSFYF